MFIQKLFEPTAQLTDAFKYVLTNIPCCNVSDQNIKNYVYKYIFDYFGFTYVTELVLGSRAQNLITMKSDDVTKLESEGISTKNEAKVSFYVTFETTISSSMEKSHQEQFIRKVQNEWSKTVPNNPIVTKFSVAFLPDLLTPARFPNDTRIIEKALLISNLLINYMKSPLFCWNNCSGNGTCIPTPFFNIGTCKCNQGFTGIDCSDLAAQVPNGSICGWALSPYTHPDCRPMQPEVISCDGLNPQLSCPSGYGQAQIDIGLRLQYITCYKLQTDSNPGKNGTLCGAPFSRCGGIMPSMEGCPPGYNYTQTFELCYKTNSDIVLGVKYDLLTT
jgi:hypothetical protein